MPTLRELAESVAAAPLWEDRIALIRSIPEHFGIGKHAEAYAAVADLAYRASIEADFAYVHWRPEYELSSLKEIYNQTSKATGMFKRVEKEDLARVLLVYPKSLRIFRLVLGFTAPEFAETCAHIENADVKRRITKGAVQAVEEGSKPSQRAALVMAEAIDSVMRGRLFPVKQPDGLLRPKIDKPDTSAKWNTIRKFAAKGVPLAIFLHQRFYGGSFRQLLDATSSQRGDLLEAHVANLLTKAKITYIQTGAHNQAVVKTRFHITVRPAPDFVIYRKADDQLCAILECKAANDGGTARDKAARFRSLKTEATRLGGIPLIAVLTGIGWRRTRDALGPVIRDTDGRTFTPATLPDILTIEPFKKLRASRRRR